MKTSLTTEYPSQDKTEKVSLQYIYCSKIFKSQKGINIPDIFLSRKIRFWHEIRHIGAYWFRQFAYALFQISFLKAWVP